MKVLAIDNVAEIVKRHGFREYIEDLMKTLERDFGRWQEFNKIPRPAMRVPHGVLELMPICDDEYYSFKYVNCHPKNPASGLMTVVATGQLSTVDTGYPILFSELTLLTAMRTAATSALATRLMARPDSRVLTMIGTGAQGEFQMRATQIVCGITEVRYFDADPKAMDKFERNLKGTTLKANTSTFRCFGLVRVLQSLCSVCSLASVWLLRLGLVMARVSRRVWRAVPRAAEAELSSSRPR